jgi:SHS2 domain-containing protein
MQNKKYIVRATADIAVTVETSTPENVKELLESALMDVCDISADVKDISVEEQSPLP